MLNGNFYGEDGCLFDQTRLANGLPKPYDNVPFIICI